MELLLATLGVVPLLLLARADGSAEGKDASSANQDLVRARSRMLAGMSHELKTPLNAVIGFAELLADDPRLDDSQRGYARRISEGGHRLLGMIETVVELARADAGRIELEVEEVDPAEAIRRSVGAKEALLAQRQVAVEVRAGDALPRVRADRRRLGQLVGCLLDAVLAASGEGDRIQLVASPTGDGGLRLRVSGSARALGVHLTRDVFDLAGGELDPYSEQAPGAGAPLGLARRLAELHGGRAWTETASNGRPGGFVVELPAGPPEGSSG